MLKLIYRILAELRAQIRQLTDGLDAQYQQRQELSEVILHDAKSRLAKIQATVSILRLAVRG